jgi:hypothetical protein
MPERCKPWHGRWPETGNVDPDASRSGGGREPPGRAGCRSYQVEGSRRWLNPSVGIPGS